MRSEVLVGIDNLEGSGRVDVGVTVVSGSVVMFGFLAIVVTIRKKELKLIISNTKIIVKISII